MPSMQSKKANAIVLISNRKKKLEMQMTELSKMLLSQARILSMIDVQCVEKVINILARPSYRKRKTPCGNLHTGRL